MDDVVACGVLQDCIAHRPRVQCRPPRQENAQLLFLVQLSVAPNGCNEAPGAGLVTKPGNGMHCIAKNINLMSARMQFAAKRKHVLAQSAELRLRDVFADQQNTHFSDTKR